MEKSSSSSNLEETELTMCDVLEEEEELEEDARAVLGGSDDTNCSYDKGYVSRQALYSCITCSDNKEPGGICLACSYKCHDGHDIVELYTKRNFRCDCGNSKFPGKTCCLKPDKHPFNKLNKYNQNFKGLYCNCKRPYPDLEDDTPDAMMQCIICEDWYHGRHIGIPVPDEYFEMICLTCMDSHKFLYSYLNKFHYVNVCGNSVDEIRSPQKNSSLKKEPSDAPIGESLSNLNGTVRSEESSSIIVQSPLVKDEAPSFKTENDLANGTVERENSLDKVAPSVKDELSLSTENDSKREVKSQIKSELPDECVLKKIVTKDDSILSGPAFWPENWRKELCQCTLCMNMYRELGCTYLIDLNDTILAYEEQGKCFSESQYDKGLSALGKMDRVKQMEAVRGYTNMKDQLKEYLKEFAKNKKTVSENDIKEFFERISKKRKLNNGVPHFCR